MEDYRGNKKKWKTGTQENKRKYKYNNVQNQTRKTVIKKLRLYLFTGEDGQFISEMEEMQDK